jgi:hypothetical protein
MPQDRLKEKRMRFPLQRAEFFEPTLFINISKGYCARLGKAINLYLDVKGILKSNLI